MTPVDVGELLVGTRYRAYTYSYPHKTAYRVFDEPVPLSDVWAAEDRSALFLYLHVPFCEMRCGFCNLFTQIGADDSLTSRYLDQLERQARQVVDQLGAAQFARVAIGGGTPTFLAPADFDRLLSIAASVAGPLSRVPVGIETSPATATDEHLAVAKSHGVDRVSIGVQSFFDAELKALGRPSTRAAALAALQRIRQHDFGTLNIDLIYGGAGQTLESLRESIASALRFEPEELYLYPLYVRPLTGLGRRGAAASDARPAQYEAATEQLDAAGYEQVSLRMFRRRDVSASPGPLYCCQEDGMVGLGCGARSYTRGLHYADDWAVSSTSVKGIIAEWVQRPPQSFASAQYGIALHEAEQRRRYLIQSLAIRSGLPRGDYRRRFGSDPIEDFPQLQQLVRHGLVSVSDETVLPTASGLAWADAVGPWLYSDEVVERMEGFVLR